MKRNRLNSEDHNLCNEPEKRNKTLNDDLWGDDSDCMFTQEDLLTIEEQEKQYIGKQSATNSAAELRKNTFSPSKNNSVFKASIATLNTRVASNSSAVSASLVTTTSLTLCAPNKQSQNQLYGNSISTSSVSHKATTRTISVTNNPGYDTSVISGLLNENEVESLRQQIKQLENEKKKLIEEQYAKDGHITMMKTTMLGKEEQIRQLYEEKLQWEKNCNEEKARIEKKYAEELQKLQSRLMFEEKEKSDEKDAYRRLLKLQQQQQDSDCSIIPPTQDQSMPYNGRRHGISCSPGRRGMSLSPSKQTSLVSHINKRQSHEGRASFPNVQSFMEIAKSSSKDAETMTINTLANEANNGILCEKFQRKLSVRHSKDSTCRRECVPRLVNSHLLDTVAGLFCACLSSTSCSGLDACDNEQMQSLASRGLDMLVSNSDTVMGAICLLPAMQLCLAHCLQHNLSFCSSGNAKCPFTESKANKQQSQCSNGAPGGSRGKLGSRHQSVCGSRRPSCVTSQVSDTQCSSQKRVDAQAGDNDNDRTIQVTVSLLSLLEQLVMYHDEVTQVITGSSTNQLMKKIALSSQLLLKQVQSLKLVDSLIELANPTNKNWVVVCQSLQVINQIVASCCNEFSANWFCRLFSVQCLIGCFLYHGESDYVTLAMTATDVLQSVALSGHHLQNFCNTSAGSDCALLAVCRYCDGLDVTEHFNQILLAKVFVLLRTLSMDKYYGAVMFTRVNCHCSAMIVRMLVMQLWRLAQVARGDVTSLHCVQLGVRLLHDLALKDIHWQHHRRNIMHFFTDLCITAEHLFTDNNLSDDLLVLNEIYVKKEDETEEGPAATAGSSSSHLVQSTDVGSNSASITSHGTAPITNAKSVFEANNASTTGQSTAATNIIVID